MRLNPIGEKGTIALRLGLGLDIGRIIKIMGMVSVVPEVNIEINTPLCIGLNVHDGCRQGIDQRALGDPVAVQPLASQTRDAAAITDGIGDFRVSIQG